MFANCGHLLLEKLFLVNDGMLVFSDIDMKMFGILFWLGMEQ